MVDDLGDGAAFVEWERKHRLPLNRKERFYTGTVLPVILSADDFANLSLFLDLCGLHDAVPHPSTPQGSGTAPCQLISEYNFMESLVGADDRRWEVKPRLGDTPDVVLVGDDWLIAVEAKVFSRPTTADLVAQLKGQRPLLDEWSTVLEIPSERVHHIALLPEQLAAEMGDVVGASTVTWQAVADSYRSVGPAYWVGVIDVACSHWPQLRAKVAGFGLNAEAKITGLEIVRQYSAGTLSYEFMGRRGGLGADKLVADVATGSWRSHVYEVRTDALPGSTNWFPIAAFVALVETPGSSAAPLSPASQPRP